MAFNGITLKALLENPELLNPPTKKDNPGKKNAIKNTKYGV